jgi:undecaprenyl-diphosphatase
MIIINFLHYITEIDKQILLLINGANTPFFDMLMTYISNKYTWIPLYILLLIMTVIRFRKYAHVVILIFIVTIIFADQGSVHLFKNVFQRLRPCHNEELQSLLHLVNDKCGGRFGFVSSHAANTAALTTSVLLLLGKKFKWLIPIFLFYTISNCYSRVYLGVHYPSDVIVGAMYGCFSAWVAVRIYTVIFSRKVHAN